MPVVTGPSSPPHRALATGAGGQDATGSTGSTPAPVDADSFDGGTVRNAERLLKKLGFHPGNVDRTYTANTEAAVKSFQAAVGLDATGHLDVRTLSAMRAAAQRKDHGISAAGQSSGGIKKIEQRLRRLGYDAGPADGVFDKKTEAAVRAFKADQKIGGSRVSRGLMGQGARRQLATETAHLNHAPERRRVMKTAARSRDDRRVATAAAKVHVDGTVGFGPGSKGKSVQIVQRHLRAAGFDPKHANGTFDERTAGMVKEFQRKKGLPATGRVDSSTWTQLKTSTLEAVNGSATSPHQALNERSSAVKKTERMLKDLGFKTGNVDGLYTRNTQKAVDAFRRRKGLGGAGDGVGPGTLRSIRKAWKAKMTPSTNTVRGCAQFLLRSNNVSFWSGLSTDRTGRTSSASRAARRPVCRRPDSL